MAMPETKTFGSCLKGVRYTERPAAYAVVGGEHNTVAAVRGTSGMIGLPGGGSLPGETPEETLVREVREELARSLGLAFAASWRVLPTEPFYEFHEFDWDGDHGLVVC